MQKISRTSCANCEIRPLKKCTLPQARWWAYGFTALTALLLGAVKACYTQQGPIRAGLEFLVVVTLGTLAGVGLGLLLH
jgi:FtsH-binding integral membrane protein